MITGQTYTYVPTTQPYLPHVHQKDKDVYIDMQHADHSCTDPIAYAEEPWKNCKDHVNCFLGLRESMRQKFKENLEGKKLQRVEHEEKRIKQTRVNFASYPKKEQMMTRLQKARNEWKVEVKARRKEYVETIKKRVERRDRLPRYPQSWGRDLTLDLALLERVSLIDCPY